MTMEHDVSLKGKFVSAILPWIVAASALALYLVTLNRWVSFGSLLQVARISGWTWQPELHGPLYWLLTYPLRFLPEQFVPLALNLFAAVCATLSLALLARSVALLPHDRTHDQRERERSPYSLLSIRDAWVPPVLAVLVCGLQLSFWENATVSNSSQPLSASNEMLDLLLFAYVIRCLLEYRIHERESWLTRAALVYGIGMANNWAMIGYLPLFLVALVWIKGISFFEARFLGRMFLWGFPGLLLYFLLPLVQSLADISQVPFWQALKTNLGGQKYILLALPFSKAAVLDNDKPLWILGLFSLLPILVIGIRWPAFLGDTSKHGSMVTRLLFRVVHGFFLIICIWVAFDPPFSPRNRELGIAFLTLYYLGALAVGYCSGYFLLLATRKQSRWRRVGQGTILANGAITVGIWMLLVLVPAGLIHKNLPPIRQANGPMYRQYASLLAEGLPAQKAFLLSDDPRRMLLLHAAVAQTGRSKDYVFVDSGSLPFPDYHRFLKKTRPDLWPREVPKEYQQAFEQVELLRLLGDLAGKASIYYLHHSFGYFFELFYLEPRGMLCKLNPYPGNALLRPDLPKELIDQNKAFWEKAEQQAIRPLLATIREGEANGGAGAVSRTIKQLLSRAESAEARLLGALYSHALVYWGVELQKHRLFSEAGDSFRLAQELNPRNFVAEINLRCNTNLQAGATTQIRLTKTIEDELSKYAVWDQMIGANGPFDEPGFCYEQGRVLVRGNSYRQAAQQFARVKELDPQDFNAAMWLGELYLMSKMPDEALKLVEEVRSRPLASAGTNRCELLLVEASAHLAKDDYSAAGSVIRSAMAKHPNDHAIMETAAQVYLNFKSYSNALPILDEQLKLNPNNMSALVNKGFVCLQLSAYDQAIPPLTKVLSIETNNYSALLNRAIASLRCDRLDEAQRDYDVLAKVFTNAFQVYYGLGEIAYRKKNKQAAIQNYELYLSKGPPAEEAVAITERLRELNSTP